MGQVYTEAPQPRTPSNLSRHQRQDGGEVAQASKRQRRVHGFEGGLFEGCDGGGRDLNSYLPSLCACCL